MKQRLINFLLHRVLNTIVQDDVIRESKGIIYLGNKEIKEQDLRILLAEIKALETMSIWRIINETIKQDALDRGWNKSTSVEDLNVGKTMFYTLDLQNSIIRTLKSKEKK